MTRVSWFAKVPRVWPWLAAISSGLLCTGCFPPFDQTWLCWIALTPLIAAIWFSGEDTRHPWLRNLLLGYVAGLTFFWTVLSWLTTVTMLGWFVLEFYMAIYFAFWTWFCGLVRPRNKRGTKFNQMGPDVGPGRPRRVTAAISVDKIHKQSITSVCSRRWVDNPGMVARLGFLRVGLERSWRRVAR